MCVQGTSPDAYAQMLRRQLGGFGGGGGSAGGSHVGGSSGCSSDSGSGGSSPVRPLRQSMSGLNVVAMGDMSYTQVRAAGRAQQAGGWAWRAERT